MNKISLPILIFLLMACSTKQSTEWERLTGKYFEYDRRGDYDSARYIGELALNDALKNFTANDIRTAKSYNNLAEMHRELGQTEKALPMYMKAIEISIANNDSVNSATFYANLGHLYSGIDDYTSAKQAYENSILIREKIYSPIDKELITPLRSLALIEMDEENLTMARFYLKRADKCADVGSKASDTNISKIYQDWGRLLLKERNTDSAYFFLRESQRLQEETLPVDHPSLEDLYGLLGVCYHVKHEYDSAEKYYQKELNLIRTTNGKKSQEYQTLKNLGLLYRGMGDSIKGKEFESQATDLKSVK